jgi:hypothetical protein
VSAQEHLRIRQRLTCPTHEALGSVEWLMVAGPLPLGLLVTWSHEALLLAVHGQSVIPKIHDATWLTVKSIPAMLSLVLPLPLALPFKLAVTVTFVSTLVTVGLRDDLDISARRRRCSREAPHSALDVPRHIDGTRKIAVRAARTFSCVLLTNCVGAGSHC